MTTTTYDVDRVRAQFPALAHGIAHFGSWSATSRRTSAASIPARPSLMPRLRRRRSRR